MSNVVLKGVSKQFGQNLIIPTLDLEVKSKEFMVLVGPSGCGKSTLLRMVAGLESPSTGEILIDGKNVTKTSPKERGVAMVFQNYALYPHMTVRENIIFPLKLAKVDKTTREKKAEEVAEVLDLTVHLDKKPGQLSGGQKQRVAMGRAMVRNPKVLLFDEPLSNLDAQLRVKMRSEIALLHKRLGCTVLYVTHDQVEAMTLASRIVVLKKGNIEQLGAPLDVYHKPNTQFVASFIGTPSMNFLESAMFREKVPSGCATVGFRAEACSLQSGGSANVALGKGKVVLVEPIGHTAFVHLEFQKSRIVSEMPVQQSPAILSDCEIYVDPKKMFYFSDQGSRMEGGA